MAVSITWGALFVGFLLIRAVLFGVYIGAPDFRKLPYGSAKQKPAAERVERKWETRAEAFSSATRLSRTRPGPRLFRGLLLLISTMQKRPLISLHLYGSWPKTQNEQLKIRMGKRTIIRTIMLGPVKSPHIFESSPH